LTVDGSVGTIVVGSARVTGALSLIVSLASSLLFLLLGLPFFADLLELCEMV